jgi:DNA-binding NarL/FixJ family response regulator
MAPALRETEALHLRDQEILAFLAQTLAAKDIAMKMDLSYQTLRVHLRNIYEKLHVHSRTEAVQKWVRQAR